MSEPAFAVKDRVRIEGITALKGQTGVVRGTRGHGRERRHFVSLDKRHWPAIAENGIWVPTSQLSRVE